MADWLIASMRPRPEGRGERAEVGSYRPASPRLQCGHDPKAVENQQQGTVYARAAVASMRPRPEGRGELALSLPPRHRTHPASMRPRPEGRGEPRPSTACRKNDMPLQCGHDPKAVENGPDGGRRGVLDPASMRPRPEGRGERRGGNKALTVIASFNAATTRRPWRTDHHRGGGVPVAFASMRPRPEGRGEHGRCGGGGPGRRAASMRPRPEGRGELLAPAVVVEGGVASMRPRPEGRGEPAHRRRTQGAEWCFNAATTRRPWRTTFATFRGRDSAGLQCGHDPKAVENRAGGQRRRRWRRRTASMRPRPEGRGELEITFKFSRQATRLQCGHDPKAVENPA